jgi:8-oxo-dGTP diphosphatase
MGKQKFRVIAAGIVTNGKEVLLGKKEKTDDHPISEEWHFPGGHVDKGEEPQKAVKREIEEETSLNVDVHQLLKVYNTGTGAVRILYHCEANSTNAEPKDDLEDVKWVEVGELEESLDDEKEMESIETKEIQNFIEKLKKMPVV